MAKEPEVVSPSRIERLLDLACAYTVPLNVTTEAGGKTYRYKSRMLEMKTVPSGRILIIDQPFTDGPAIALKPELSLTIYFALERNPYRFESTIVKKTMVALKGRRESAALEVTYPTVLREGDRRSYCRISAPVEGPILVECGLINDKADWFLEETDEWNLPPHMRFRGTISNVSVTGMLITIERTDQGSLETQKRIGLRFSLAENETPLMLQAVARRVERDSSAEQMKVAVEFVDTDERFEYKLAINRLYRYVAERQRELDKSGEQ